MSLRRTLQSIIALAVFGLGISAYLTWTYVAQVAPICGESGGCATVQSSAYAWIMGVPVPLLGGLVYLALILLGALALLWTQRRDRLILALFGFSLAGVLFSGYLTYLELYVIHALCKWCIASAVVILFVFSLALVAHRQQLLADTPAS